MDIHAVKFRIKRGDYDRAKTHTEVVVKEGGQNPLLLNKRVAKHIEHEITEVFKKKRSMKLILRASITMRHEQAGVKTWYDINTNTTENNTFKL
jgi:hypothetical protein